MSVAFLFPGQGGQHVGMMDAYRNVSCVRSVFEEASYILNRDLWLLVEEGPADLLSLTENTQPVMLAADVAVWRLFQEQGKIADENDVWLAGHSLGEYAALVAAGAISFEDALRVVCYRARVMQDAVPEGQGAMAAVLGLSAACVVGICRNVSAPGAVVEAVNFNSALQTVIGGHRTAVERASLILKNNGARKVVSLDMSVPSHSSLMHSARDKMRVFLKDVVFNSPCYPVVHNLTADICINPSDMCDTLASQLCSPVRWTETISFIQRQSIHRFVQCGPGNVMAGLLRKVPGIDMLLSSDYCPV